DGPDNQARVLFALARLCDGKGTCFPSYEYLVEHAHKSRRTVIRIINSLVQSGWIRKTPKPGKPNTFTIPFLAGGCHSSVTPQGSDDPESPDGGGVIPSPEGCHSEPRGVTIPNKRGVIALS